MMQAGSRAADPGDARVDRRARRGGVALEQARSTGGSRELPAWSGAQRLDRRSRARRCPSARSPGAAAAASLRGRDDHRPRARIVEDVQVVALGVGGVGRRGDAARGHDREVGDRPFGAVLGDQHHAVAVARAPCARSASASRQTWRAASRPAQRLPCAAALGGQERPLAELVGALEEQRDEIAARMRNP